MDPSAASGVRRAEIIAALSLATDFAMGQPAEFALKSCVLGMRLGEAVGLSRDELSEVWFQALLRYVGCNAETYVIAALFGDEIDFRREFALVDMARAGEVIPLVFRHLRRANAGAGLLDMAAGVTRGLMTGQKASAENITGHCEVADRLAERLGLGTNVRRNLNQIYERWDGRGLPQGLKGEAVAPAVRIVNFVQDVIVLRAAHGEEAALAKLEERSGSAYEPLLVERFGKRAGDFTAGLDDASNWEAVLALEPAPHAIMTAEELDAACLAMADFADIKSPFTLGHSRAVSALAADAARRAGLPEADAVDLARAGLLHDIGQVGIPASIWLKRGNLTPGEWEQVRLHPYYGERVLSRSAPLARLGAIVAQHHERCDGSGYHRAVQTLSLPGRILAAAEAYQGMIEERPHRAALSPAAAADAIRREVRAGRFDADAADAVLAAAGHRTPARKRLVADLTEREVEVLRLVARGQSMKEIARNLGISPKTVDNHIQNLYAKIEVKTRAAATLFAIERGLAGPGEP